MLSDSAQAFLQTTRLGFLSYRIENSGWSRPVPVWFDWDGDAAHAFSGASAPKVGHLRHDPTAHLLVANQVGEPEAWISLTADVEFSPVEPAWLEAVSARYWNLAEPAHRTEVDEWLAHIDDLILLTLRPNESRQYGLSNS